MVRGNLSADEARTALSNLAEVSIATVLASVVADFVDRRGPVSEGGAAAILLGDLAGREAHPGVAADFLFVHDGPGDGGRLCALFLDKLTGLTQNSLLFSPVPHGTERCVVLPSSDLAEHCRSVGAARGPDLTRARCVFETGDSRIGGRFDEVRRDVLSEWGASTVAETAPDAEAELDAFLTRA